MSGVLDTDSKAVSGKPRKAVSHGTTERLKAMLADKNSDEGNGLFWDSELKIFPWGFSDALKESKYRQYFYLTFASNNKRILMWAYLASAVGNGYSSARYLAFGNVELKTLGTDLALTCMSCVMVYFFSRQVLPSLFRRLFMYFLEFIFWVSPYILIWHPCSPNASYSKTLIDMTVVCFTGFLCCPRWLHMTANGVFFAWVPILWNVLSGQQRFQLLSEAGGLSFFGQWCVDALCINIVSILFGSVVCVHRRRAWLYQKTKGRRRESEDRTAAPSSQSSISRSRSPSPARSAVPGPRKRIATSQGKSRSPSPLPDAKSRAKLLPSLDESAHACREHSPSAECEACAPARRLARPDMRGCPAVSEEATDAGASEAAQRSAPRA